MRKYSYKGPTSFQSLDQINNEIKKASEKYSRFRPKAHEFRLTYRESLAQEIAAATNRDPEKILKDINHREERKELFRQIRRKEKRGERYGVDRVDVETESGLKTIVGKEEIENAIPGIIESIKSE